MRESFFRAYAAPSIEGIFFIKIQVSRHFVRSTYPRKSNLS